ncbi:MAG: homoserine dehydrogenase [Spirochaetales bacterium]|nr:homoserine dehydrogenase [Spirochaetales bacterium]
MSAKKIGIAVIGCGVVGGSTAKILIKDRELLKQKTGIDLNLKYIVDLNFSRAQELGFDSSLFQSDLNKVLEDPEVEICVETIGGTTIAKDITEKVLKAGRQIVTANKALLALHGTELMATAREHNTAIGFEASCGGGIPLIRALCDGLSANRIDAFYGIVNGTCNYILTEMIQKGQSYSDALAQAQKDGLAEADPTLDVTGGDSSHKLAIMSALAFGEHIEYSELSVQGIDTLDLTDVKYGAELGYIVKLLAIAQRKDDGFSLRVAPAFISQEHPLAWVNGPFNAMSVYGNNVGHTMYYGRGAGGLPTGSAVVSDIINCAMGITKIQFDTMGIWPDLTKPAKQLPVEDFESKYYIRVMVEDKPGVLSKLSGILAEHNISIASALQKETVKDNNSLVPIVITTYSTKEGNISKAINSIENIDGISGKAVCIGIVDEHEEFAD